MVELTQEEPANTCCVALKKKQTKLVEKYLKLKERKNTFRDYTALIQQKYDVIEKEYENLKQAMAKLKVQADTWKDEKEKETAIRVDLEDEVSALKEENQLLKQNGISVSQEANDQIQERVNVAEKEINRLKELLERERRTAPLEKKNAEFQRKKADEAMQKVQVEKNKASETQKVANMERKKAEENRLLWEKLKTETDALKSSLASERSKSEAAYKKVEAEKQKAIGERKKADLAVAKAEQQRKLAETNLKEKVFEKDRADDLNQKLVEMRSRNEKLEELRGKKLCPDKLLKAHIDASNTGKSAVITNDVCMGIVKSDAIMSQKQQSIVKEKKHSDTNRKKLKEQKKVAKAHKRMARKEKHRADQLSTELEFYKLRLAEVQKELQESVSYRMHADNSPLRYDDVISETDTVRLLKKQLKLEKMLVKHAKKATRMESIRNDMLHQELIHLKHVFLRLQHHLDMLDDSFLHGSEGTHQLKKVGNLTSTREFFCSDGHRKQFISGIISGLDPPYRGSNRKMLESSAINSRSTSFSDRQLVGSQERGVFSVTTSAKLGENVSNLERTMSRLSNKKRIRTNEHAVDNADNSIGCPIKGNAKEMRVGSVDKNKILDAVESIENLYSEGQKLHQRVSEELSQLHGILDCQKDEPAEENSCRENVRPSKRRRTSREGSIVIHPFHDSDGQKTMLGLDIDQSDTFTRALPLELDVMKSGQCFQDGTEDRCISQDVFEMASYDYMKLLDLDNVADEESYRLAIAKPLSPTLPEIEFQEDEKLDLDDPEMLVDKNFQEGLSTVKAPTPIMAKNPTDLELNGVDSSELQTKGSSIGCNKNINSLQASDSHFQQIHVSGEIELPDLSHSGNKETNILCESRIASSPSGCVKYLVFFSDNKDNDSILRILQTMENCMPPCSLIHSAEIFLQSLLPSLLKAEDLVMKEKVCVFFSVLLHGISEVGTKNWTNVVTDNLVQSLGSLTLHIRSALSDLVLRRIFMESCDLFELLALIGDFLLQRKILIRGDVSAESHVVCSPKVNVVLNGNAIMLSEVVASAQLLVMGGSLLASLCSAVDHIGFVCEMSCNIFGMHKFEPSVVLAVLHAFAQICGSKYFTLEQYAVPMTVVKSLVIFLEKQAMSTNSTSSFHSMVETPKAWICCTSCPFSDGAVSMEDVAHLLLKKLQEYGQSISWPLDSLQSINSLIHSVQSREDRTEKVSSLREAVTSTDTSDENLCSFIDILSLVEILASFMSWSWTFDNIIGQICEWLESRPMEGFSAVIVILLGQLGRLGVGASGCGDIRVEKLRGWLSALLCRSNFRKLRLPIQFAIINALLGLIPIKFEEIVEDGAETPAVINQCLPANSIKEWFCQLSSEQQLVFRLNHGCW